MKQYEMFELSFTAEPPEGSDVEINLTAEFTMDETTTAVKGFYAGNGRYLIRFYPQKTGLYTYKVNGIVELSGEEFCHPSDSCGIVRTEQYHFIYENGDRYLPFGTTIYALAHQEETLIEETLAALENSPFNKVRHCVFPKHYDYNHNEPSFYPFEKKEDGSWDVHHPCFRYWDHLEAIIHRLGTMGIESDLILFHPYDRWGFASLSMEENLVYLEYALRRLSAIPYIWWSMANEYDVVFTRTPEDWYAIENYIVNNDPYHHLLSNHNCLKLYDFSRPAVTHCSIQTIAMHMTDEWIREFDKPVIFDECCYEGDIQHEWGNISAFEMVDRFWRACAKGAYATHGETFYSEDEILWWSKGGRLKGESPARIAFLKELLYSFPAPLESWTEPIFEDFSNPTETTGDRQQNPFLSLWLSLPANESANLAWKMAAYTGNCGDDVFLKYYSHQCPRLSSIKLPKDHTYKIEIIDVWNMTRETLIAKASGKTPLSLPGKEGIAVIATKI